MQRSHKLCWHPTLLVLRGILELSHLQKSSSLKSSRKSGHTLHKPCFIEGKIKKAAKRAGVRSAGRASCSRVASVPSPSSHVLQLYRPFQASSSPHSPNHAVSSIYCRKLAGGGFFPPLALGAAPIPLPRGCVGSWPNKHCPAPLLPRTSSFRACFPRSVWGAAAPLMHLQAEGAGGGSWKALSRKMP